MSFYETFAPRVTVFHAGTSGLSGVLHALYDAVCSRLAALETMSAQRRAMAQLGRMSHAELQDIGLCRADLTYASNLPLGSNPTAALSQIVAERRGRRR